MNDSEMINISPDWANEVSSFPEALKIKDGESKTFTFLDNGKKHPDLKNKKEDIVFQVSVDGQNRSWYVNTKSFSTLADIKNIGFPLIGKTITLSRKGSARFDTRYTITLNKQ